MTEVESQYAIGMTGVLEVIDIESPCKACEDQFETEHLERKLEERNWYLRISGLENARCLTIL